MSSSEGTSTAAPKQETSTNSSHNGSDVPNHFVISKCRRNKEVSVTPNVDGQQETSEETESEDKILVVYYRAGKLGAAYYTLQTGELFILEEIVDRGPEFLMFLNLYRQVDPVMILLEGKNQGTFVQVVRKTVFDNDARGEGSCKIHFLSSREYNFEACKRRVFSLSLPHEPPSPTEDARTLFLRTVLDFNQVQTVHSLGALLRYLDLNWAALSMDLQGKPQFLSLKTISLADIVQVDWETYRGLQVFSPVAHPSAFKRGALGSAREGLSLLRGARCSSRIGQARMRVYMQHPTRDLATLKRRQDVVEFFLKPQNDHITRNICSSLRFIKNVNGILAKIKALSAKSYQWKSLYNTLYNAVLICEICENAGQSSEFLVELASCDNNKLYEMALYMNRIIDFDLTKSEGKFTVKAGVDPDLDIKKQTMASLHSLMSETAKVELDRLPDFIEECSMLYMPHLGYLLGVKAWAENMTMEQKELPNMKFMFQNNDYIHYKSKGCEELDVMIGDTYPEIVAHETRIMMRLTAIVLDNLHTLAAVIDKCAELDCLIAISKVCKEYNYVRPVLCESKLIRIKQGRHPLYLTTCDNFVPNDYDSSDEGGMVKILTGPNSSGKSVYMKMVGLIVYLAHIGSFVPAESATIGVVSAIHSRLHSTECVANHMSAFLIELRQLGRCLRAPAGSLVLCDEAGAGGGAAGRPLLGAAAATLAHARDKHALLATHYTDIADIILESPVVQFLSFEHIVEGGQAVFLYRAVAGVCAASLAFGVAAAHGLPRAVLRRARGVGPSGTVCMEATLKAFRRSKNSNSRGRTLLPPPNKKITSKLASAMESTKKILLQDDI